MIESECREWLSCAEITRAGLDIGPGDKVLVNLDTGFPQIVPEDSLQAGEPRTLGDYSIDRDSYQLIEPLEGESQ